MVCLSFCNGYFVKSVHSWLPVVTLSSQRSVPEAPHSTKWKGRGRGGSNLKIGFGALEGPGMCSASGAHPLRAESGIRWPRANRVGKLTIAKASTHPSPTAWHVGGTRMTSESSKATKPISRFEPPAVLPLPLRAVLISASGADHRESRPTRAEVV